MVAGLEWGGRGERGSRGWSGDGRWEGDGWSREGWWAVRHKSEVEERVSVGLIWWLSDMSKLQAGQVKVDRLCKNSRNVSYTVCDNITLSYRFYETKRKRNDLFCCTKHPIRLNETDGGSKTIKNDHKTIRR